MMEKLHANDTSFAIGFLAGVLTAHEQSPEKIESVASHAATDAASCGALATVPPSMSPAPSPKKTPRRKGTVSLRLPPPLPGIFSPAFVPFQPEWLKRRYEGEPNGHSKLRTYQKRMKEHGPGQLEAMACMILNNFQVGDSITAHDVGVMLASGTYKIDKTCLAKILSIPHTAEGPYQTLWVAYKALCVLQRCGYMTHIGLTRPRRYDSSAPPRGARWANTWVLEKVPA
jgi:hypothetical protein